MRTLLAAIAVLAMHSSPASSSTPVRVACAGDSITYGDQIADRDRLSYPAALARLSGGRYLAANHGVNGATALRIPFRAWLDTSAARDALSSSPSAVVLMLGINDLAFPSLRHQFPADLREIVRRFQSLPSNPRVFLCTLTPIAPEDRQAQANRAIREEMNPAIRSVAAQTGAALVDVSAAFPNRPDLLPDGLHPNPEGAEIIARAVLAALDSAFFPPPSSSPKILPAPVAGPVDLSIRNEAAAAVHRAEQWLLGQPDSPPAQDPSAPAEPSPLLADLPLSPILSGADFASQNAYLSHALLAEALDRAGQETVFLEDGRPVRWREALLHQLVQRQRIDPRGGGFWIDPSNPIPPTASTRLALRAIATALGPAGD